MGIVKAFNSNDFHTEIVIKGTVNDPLFRASDIGVVLDIASIRSVIRDYDESEKVLHTYAHTLWNLRYINIPNILKMFTKIFKISKY